MRGRRNLLLASLLLLLALVGGIYVLQVARQTFTRQQAKKLQTAEKVGPKVEVVEARPSGGERQVQLIGETKPFFSVTLYARVSGYMTELLADVGDQVPKGKRLAWVESPETEQAYNSARANAITLRRTAARARALLRRKLISQQEADQIFSNADIAEANLKTQEVIRNYQSIEAPFDGRVTQRFVDPGALLTGSAQSASQPMFTLSQVDRLMVFIYVDQKDAPYVHEGDPVEVASATEPERRVSATVHRVAGELDVRTRTLLARVDLDNKDHRFVPGSFVQVYLRIKTPSLIQVPVQAMVIRNNEPYVPVVRPNNEIRYSKVDVAENTGRDILIRSGLQKGERVAVNVGNSLQEGTRVQPVPMWQAQGAAGEAQPGPAPSPRAS